MSHPRYRDAVLSELPPYGLFTLKLARWRGLVLAWHRSRTGERREASVLLLTGKPDAPGIRQTLRAGLRVQVDAAHDLLNLSTRNVTADDPYIHLMQVQTGRVIPVFRPQHEPEMPRAVADEPPDVLMPLPEAA